MLLNVVHTCWGYQGWWSSWPTFVDHMTEMAKLADENMSRLLATCVAKINTAQEMLIACRIPVFTEETQQDFLRELDGTAISKLVVQLETAIKDAKHKCAFMSVGVYTAMPIMRDAESALHNGMTALATSTLLLTLGSKGLKPDGRRHSFTSSGAQ